ncbi:hypothetical protein [Gynurincola endophyticus]|jgi:hypothetical protein|uniref:hypothetical protein n=1 Tax=Gynurincola endophyticus TaxID=2479004 RepID=UPI000F8C9C8C|nr:hypothetical protein [Gynurincola endophyticus]
MHTQQRSSTFMSKCTLLLTGLFLSVMFVYASTGGGDKKKPADDSKKTLSLLNSPKAIAPFRATDMTFSLKNSKDLKFIGNLKLNQPTNVLVNSSHNGVVISQTTVLKYKVGNTIYLVPKKTSYNVQVKNNLNVVDFKIGF